MFGYHNFSMSNRAVAAYESGEMPLSKWTKSALLDAVRKEASDGGLTLSVSMEALSKVPAKILKEQLLTCSSWHHTSSHFNRTNFYYLDVERTESLTDAVIQEWMASAKAPAPVQDTPAEEIWKCAFLEWSGTRKHPKATEVVEIGTVKGNWFYRKNGTKKKTNANGFRFLEKISSDH